MLAQTMSEHITDKVFLKDFYQRIEARTRTVTGCIELARLVSGYLPDETEWLKRLYTSAAGFLYHISELRVLGNEMMGRIDEDTFKTKIFMEALERSSTPDEYIRRAEIISGFLEDPGIARKAIKDAGFRFKNKKEMDDEYRELLKKADSFAPAVRLRELKSFLELHRDNLHVKRLFYKAIFDMVALDKVEALLLYFEYCRLCVRDGTECKPLLRKVSKVAFSDPEQETRVMEVLENAKGDREFESAKLREMFAPKKRPVRLDEKKVADIEFRHEEAARKLGNILHGDEELEIPAAPSRRATPGDVPSLEDIFTSKNNTKQEGLSLTLDQKKLLRRFLDNDSRLSRREVLAFARERGLFADSLIDTVNETSLEEYNDLLIEGDGEPEGIYRLNTEFGSMLTELLSEDFLEGRKDG